MAQSEQIFSVFQAEEAQDTFMISPFITSPIPPEGSDQLLEWASKSAVSGIRSTNILPGTQDGQCPISGGDDCLNTSLHPLTVRLGQRQQDPSLVLAF